MPEMMEELSVLGAKEKKMLKRPPPIPGRIRRKIILKEPKRASIEGPRKMMAKELTQKCVRFEERKREKRRR